MLQRLRYRSAGPYTSVCILGEENAGKTTIANRLKGRAFKEERDASVFDLHQLSTRIENQELNLHVHDLSGSHAFPAMEEHVVKNADILLVVFAMNDFNSCWNAVNICLEFEKRKFEKPIIVVGNKSDLFLGEPTDRETISEFVHGSLNRTYIEFSSRNDNIDKLFRCIYEEQEVAKGPYRVYTVKKTFTLSKFLAMFRGNTHSMTK